MILKTLEQWPNDTLIIYADSGVVLTRPVTPILEVLGSKNILLITQGRSTPMKQHIKREALKVFGVEDKADILNSENIWGFFMVLRNGPQTRAFVRKWLSMCQVSDALTDSPFIRINSCQSLNIINTIKACLAFSRHNTNRILCSSKEIFFGNNMVYKIFIAIQNRNIQPLSP